MFKFTIFIIVGHQRTVLLLHVNVGGHTDVRIATKSALVYIRQLCETAENLTHIGQNGRLQTISVISGITTFIKFDSWHRVCHSQKTVGLLQTTRNKRINGAIGVTLQIGGSEVGDVEGEGLFFKHNSNLYGLSLYSLYKYMHTLVVHAAVLQQSLSVTV